jgi:hypothetical protein
MGHMLKNTVIKTGSYAIGLPNKGSSTITPDHAVAGQVRWNSSTSKLEYTPNGSTWQAVAREGVSNIFVDNSAIGDGANTVINSMTVSYAAGREAEVLVHVGTVYQIPSTNYEFLGNTAIKFSSAPSPGAAITIVHNYGNTIVN